MENLMVKTDERIYKNKNGYFSDEELLEFKKMSDEDFKNLLRTHDLSTWKCPPVKYKMANCFYCMRCLKFARNLVKEKKVK